MLEHHGDYVERQASREIHKKGVPLLVSAIILREIGAGQIDLARIENIANTKIITIFEVKSKWRPAPGQWQRLKKSSLFLSYIFNISTVIRVWRFEKEILPN